jgi:hypothetical protein
MSAPVQSGVLTVEGEELQWQIARPGGSSNMYENYRGLAVELVAEPRQTRPLRLEFPFRTFRWSLPNQKREFEALLEKLVREALAKGWHPYKRGKAFIYEVNNEAAA